ncbi:hypothetical protein DPMN_086267 [Dreissena polymorpha]|uniref:Uncharacterized protein n=1 Tax=Dreissena polymorpha TaxID=45954 RepID=A0A9D3YE40_DREPO|nr:hypothetical protein DPMN_086267 [Dreissena polymorpha]
MVTKIYAKGLTKNNVKVHQKTYVVRLVAHNCTGVYYGLEYCFVCCLSLVWKQGNHRRYSYGAYRKLEHK